MRDWRPLAALGLGLVVALALLEAGARVLERDTIGELVSAIGERVDDPVLAYRTRPGTGENDGAGYRNEEQLERAEVVALGDSQTWGVNAERDESWPAQLAERLGAPVYNMGRGGYGVVQYLHQLDEALALSPRWIVVALYLGNDVYDAYDLVYGYEAHEARRHPDAGLRQRIEASAYPDVRSLFLERVRFGAKPSGAGWLEKRSALVRRLGAVRRDPGSAESDRAWATAHPEDGFVYDDGRLATVFHSRYRLAAVDSSLPKIREGLRITLAALEEIARRLQAEDAELLVVLLPTKERVFARAVASAAGEPAPPASYGRGVREEQQIATGLARHLERLGVRVLEPLARLEDAVAAGEPIFPENADGHFTPAGYGRVAEAIAGAIGSDR